MNAVEGSPDFRLDKWLWAVRIYKTRSLATEACKAGHVKIAGQNVKPARNVHLNDVIVARASEMTRTVKVKGLTERRVGPKLVPQFLEELTPPEEYAKREVLKSQPAFVRLHGVGRPTKKDRRALIRLTREELD